MRTKVIEAKVWQFNEPPVETWGYLASSLGVSEFLCRILANRGIAGKEEALSFLRPQISHLYDPQRIEGIAKSTTRILEAIERKEKICVYGDFDVDGITSTALLVSVLNELGAKVSFFIPNRFKEGYGLNVKALRNQKEKGASLIISVDCGATAINEAEFCLENKLDLIITDHHEPGEVVPAAFSIINSKTSPNYPFKELAGVGVVFKLCQALFHESGRADAISGLEKYLDLVAVGTIADIVPLMGENRILVSEGLRRIRHTKRAGLKALIEVAGLEKRKIEAHQVAFHIAPRINAGGRLSQANPVVELLLTSDFRKAHQIALDLDSYNRERQSLEEKIFKETLERIESEIDLDNEFVILLHSKEWHEGVKGIVASKLVDRFYRPAFLFTVKNNEASGSARSIPGFNLSQVLTRVKDILLSYGGHNFAAGMKVASDRLSELRYRLNSIAEEILNPEDFIPKLKIDFSIPLSYINYQLLKDLEMLAPYGVGNPHPIMTSHNVNINNYQIVGNGKHLRFIVQDNESMQEGIAFNIGRAEVKKLKNHRGLVDLAFQLEKNIWQGKEQIQLKLMDIRLKDKDKVESDPWLEDLFSNAYRIIKDEEYKNIGDSESFYTKLVGVTFENRQKILEGANEGGEVKLIREQQNPHDVNAISVKGKGGLDLGYLNARLAKQLAPYMDQGIAFTGKITGITGRRECDKGEGDSEKRYRGINLEIRRTSPSSKILIAGKQELKERERLSLLDEEALIEDLCCRLLENQILRDKQREVINILRSGENCLTIMGTGRGKSLIFHIYSALKAIKENTISIVVFPLRALVNDQHQFMEQALGKLGLRVTQLTGDIDAEHREAIFKFLNEGRFDVVLTTPEFMYHHRLKFGKIKRRISFLVVDECHHICTSTQAHRPLYKKLKEVISELGSPQTLALTATAGDQIVKQICQSLNIERVIIDPAVRDNLKLRDFRNIGSKEEYLEKWIGKGGKSIVYVNSREQSVEVAAFLRSRLPYLKNKIVFYNAGLNKEIRIVIEERFRNGEFTTIVATSAFGEGINIPEIRHVFLYHLNFNFIEFNQHSGRAGRDGDEAYIHLLFGEDDARINEFILESSAPSREKLAGLYRILKMQVWGGQEEEHSRVITLSNQELVYELELSLGHSPLNEKGVGAGLKILEELGLFSLKGSGHYRKIRLLPTPYRRLKLEECSVRFEEGVREKELFESFKNWVLKNDEEELLRMINQPIYPKEKEAN